MAGRTKPSFWVFIVLLFIVHLILHVAVGLRATAPDLVTVAVLLAARRLAGAQAAAVGLVLGILVDALSLTAFGALAVVFTVLGFLGARSRDLFDGDSLLFVGAYVFLGKWLRDAFYMVITHSAHSESWGVLLTGTPVSALYAASAAMIALTLYRAATGER